MRIFFVLALLLLDANSAAAACRSSASGTYSVSVTLSALSGYRCVNDIRVYTAGTCGETLTPAWTMTLGCSEARRMVPTDDGRLVSLLSTRASRRSWEIVRVFTFASDHVEVRSVRLDELPGLDERASTPRLELDASVLRILTTPAVTVPVQTIQQLGRRTARRRARAP